MSRTEPLVDELGDWRSRSLAGARAAIGIGDGAPPPMAAVMRSTGWYALGGLSALVLVADLQTLTLGALGPEVTATLGISKAELTAALVFKSVIVAAAGLAAATIVQRRELRGRLCALAALVFTLGAALTTFATSLTGLLIVMSGSGAAIGALYAVQPSLLVDTYSPAARVRVLSVSQAAAAAGAVAASLIAYVGVDGLGLSWRGAFLCVAGISLLATALATRLRDPGYGRLDVSAIEAAARAHSPEGGVAGAPRDDPALELGLVESCRRVLLIGSVRRLLLADALVGEALTPFVTYLAFLLRSRWHAGPGERLLVMGTLPLLAVVALVVLSGRGERLFRREPAALLRAAAWLAALAAVALVAGLWSTWMVGSMVCFAVMQAALAAVAVIVVMSLFSVVAPRLRPVVAALHAGLLLGVGGLWGVMLLGSVDRRFGTAIALGLLALPCAAGVLILSGASRTINADVDRFLEDTVESEELREVRATGRHLPMLACRHIDFSYGSLQVLFDVDFGVEEGEMIAMLGTNGAGKSTLLRVISGLGFPSRGSVRLDGADITYLDAERRLALGVSQIPGGRAVFPPLTVVENLRVSGFSVGRHRAAVDRGIDATFAAFPVLAERRNQLASTLSGGEQQMLGLGKAFILEPRLLLIDELSLGLAPKIVTELLDMVRGINERGTAIVLVEQSVNVALSLVQRAYFMEKGEVRFEGRAAELLERPDLLRSVFLEGAVAANGSQRRKRRS